MNLRLTVTANFAPPPGARIRVQLNRIAKGGAIQPTGASCLIGLGGIHQAGDVIEETCTGLTAAVEAGTPVLLELMPEVSSATSSIVATTFQTAVALTTG